MSLSMCTACLARLRLSSPSTLPRPLLPLTVSSSFSTTTLLFGDGKSKAKRATGKNVYRVGAAPRVKKNRRVVGKLPPAGERRTNRRRIVLSNTNAYEIPGLVDLSVDNMGSEDSVGRMMGLEGGVLDQLRGVRAFKTSQNWKMFRRPAVLVRGEAVEIGRGMEKVMESVRERRGAKEVFREVIAGERVSGKSVLLLQAMAMGFMSRWVVINVPEAQDFVINQSSYAPSPSTGSDPSEESEQTYIQPHLASELLQRLTSANKSVLESLRPNHSLPQSLSSDKKLETLHAIATIGVNTPQLAHRVWTHIFKELTVPGAQPRPPTLFAIDGLDHWMGMTKYRSQEHKPIHAHQFELIRQFHSLLFSNTQQLSHGGMVLGATTRSNNPSSPTFDVLLRQIQALNSGSMKMTDEGFPMPSPYSKPDPRVLNLLTPPTDPDAPATTKVTTLSGLSKPLTASLLSYYTNSGILKLAPSSSPSSQSLDPMTVSEKWTLSSGGVIGELAKIGVAARLDPDKTITRYGTLRGIGRGEGRGEHRPRTR